jgi:hypothetical protein
MADSLTLKARIKSSPLYHKNITYGLADFSDKMPMQARISPFRELSRLSEADW